MSPHCSFYLTVGLCSLILVGLALSMDRGWWP